MIINYSFLRRFRLGVVGLCLLLSQISCKEEILNETPPDFLSADVVLVNKAGFDTYMTGLHQGLREWFFGVNNHSQNFFDFNYSADLSTSGDAGVVTFKDFRTWLTPAQAFVTYHWNSAYQKIIPRANTIIDYAQRPTAVWKDEAEKNAAIAEARFFRAYAYNILAKLYGGVPIVEQVASEPKLDYTRATRQQVYEFAAKDLEFASQWLPKSTTQDGRVVKAAADHLLAEVYISLGQFDKSIASATTLINDGQYQLMTSRFGKYANQPGDVFSDLFKDNNQNRNTSGNKETIWSLQFEYLTPGGTTPSTSNFTIRAWGPRYFNIKDPDGKSGMVIVDSLLRPVGWLRGTNLFNYFIWSDRNDIRNSRYNIRRDFYYNDPSSKYFGQKVIVTPESIAKGYIDTLYFYYPYIRKIEGEALAGAASGQVFKEFYLMRLAETYLLRAEAYLMKGDKQRAADDINVVRSRAKAKAVAASDVSLDYILDERGRELIIEEPRYMTLSRMGKVVERIRKYNFRNANNIEEKHGLFPIPQSFIDANFGDKIEQNPGY